MNKENPKKQEIARDKKGRWPAGTSGNPDGRPTFSLISILKEELQKVPENEKHSVAYLLIQTILKSAIFDGNDAQIRNILQYVEGMPKQPIEHSGEIRKVEVVLYDGVSREIEEGGE